MTNTLPTKKPAAKIWFIAMLAEEYILMDISLSTVVRAE